MPIQPNNKWYVYILLCADLSLYTGVAKDPPARLLVHQQGKGAKYTKSHLPERIIFTQEFSTRGEALKREYEIKQWPREEKIRKLSLKPR
jgi:putative endonuclease